MRTGVVVLNFGEPEHATLAEVVPYLEKIFLINAPLEPAEAESARQRSRQLAQERAPGLIEEYEKIGGSPLHAQARAEAAALERELRGRGHEVSTYVAMQFTEPTIAATVQRARADGVQRLIALPAYPLCGPSTTVAALQELRDAVLAANWPVELREITGWHVHPLYTQARAHAIRAAAQDAGIDLHDPSTRLLFSAHGTPRKYLDEGSRYEQYVRDSCRRIAGGLDVSSYLIGYQNHSSRPGVEWTQPSIEQVVATVNATTLVVDAVSFVHEQSETLAELDHGLREMAEDRGIKFCRVPVPFRDSRLATVMADLVEPLITESGAAYLRPCRCRELPGVWCLN